jgi:hypothetical protein
MILFWVIRMLIVLSLLGRLVGTATGNDFSFIKHKNF